VMLLEWVILFYHTRLLSVALLDDGRKLERRYNTAFVDHKLASSILIVSGNQPVAPTATSKPSTTLRRVVAQTSPATITLILHSHAASLSPSLHFR
jgi:hypothetical protein